MKFTGETAFGIFLLLLGLWEFVAVRNHFHSVQKYATASTSHFVALALYSGTYFGVCCLIFSILFILNLA